jgi:hypothetical protein
MQAAKKQTPVSEFTPELDTPRYLLGDAAAAAGVTPITLKAWLSPERSVVPLGPYDQSGRGKGVSRLLSLRRIYAIAFTSELISLGFAASQAGQFGFLVASYLGLMMEKQKTLYLTANPTAGHFRLFGDPEESVTELLRGDPRKKPTQSPLSCAIVDCAALMERVRTRLKERGA